jgi:Dolichyl-phosphate-mannose-protein mannosyltransferase
VKERTGHSWSPVTGIAFAELWLTRHWLAIGIAIVLAGLVPRVYYAQVQYLNPDEALHYLAAAQSPATWLVWNPKAALVAHPPLFLWLLHAVLTILRSQLALRLIPVVSGALFPWFVMLWVRRVAGTAAALSALLILTFSPALISLSTEVRAYTLSFLFASISLYLLDRVFERRSARDLAWFNLFLCLSILSEFSNIWFVLASSLCALIWLWTRRASRQLWVMWLAGQSVALLLYTALYFIGIRHWLGDISAGAVNDWLRQGYLQPGDNVVSFAITRSLSQFLFLFGAVPTAMAGALLFLWGFYRLLRLEPATAALTVLPFIAACLGAVFHILPYTATRHTAFLSIFAAVGIGQALAILFRNRILPVLLAGLVLIPFWLRSPIQVPMTIPGPRHQLSQMREAVQFLRTRVPAGSTLVTDVGTAFTLNYYFQSSDYSIEQTDPYRIWQLGNLQLVAFPVFNFNDDTQLREAISKVRADFHPAGEVWVAAAGFEIRITNPAAAEPFQQAIAVFRVQ